MTILQSCLAVLAIFIVLGILYIAASLIYPPQDWPTLVLGWLIIFVFLAAAVYFASNGHIGRWKP